MEYKDFLSKHNKIALEVYLTEGFKNFSCPDFGKIVNVDIATYINSTVCLTLTYEDEILETEYIKSKRYYTKDLTIDSNLNVVSNSESEDVQFLAKLLNDFKEANAMCITH